MAIPGHSVKVPRDQGLSVLMLLDNHFGPDLRVLREVELLAGAGLKVTVLAWDRRPQPDPVPVALPAAARVIRVHAPASPGGGLRTLPARASFMGHVLLRHSEVLRKASLLVAHDIYLLPFAALLQLILHIPLVYDAHEDFAVAETGVYPHCLLALARRAETALARQADLVVVPGRVRQQRWTEAGLPPPVVLANTGMTSSFASTEDSVEIEWDLVYCGLLDDCRRPDLLVDLAKVRPDIAIALAGNGRAAGYVASAASELPNLSFLGWVADPQVLLRRARAVYYGLDPTSPYARLACPNNLYQAIRARRPLIFFCGGEPRELADRFRIGLQISPDIGQLARAVDAVRDGAITWEFAEASAYVESSDNGREYLGAMEATLRRSRARPIDLVPAQAWERAEAGDDSEFHAEERQATGM